MSFMQQLFNRQCRVRFPSVCLYQQGSRQIADRSFRLANVSDLAVGQEFKDRANQEHFASFQHTAEIHVRDISKQLVIDLSHEQGYRRGHIKGAVNLSLEKFDFCKPIDTYGGITQDEVYSVFKQLGVNNETSEIILYDNSGLLSCRLWFVLRYFGFTNVRILNGGWRSWLRAGMPVDEQPASQPKTNTTLDLKPKRTEILTKPTQMIFDHEHKKSIYIDTRKPEAFKSYHISRAVNVPSRRFMQDGEFFSAEEVRAVLGQNGIEREGGSQSLILYSTSGLTASVGYFAISMAGYNRLSVYDGGIENWRSNFEDTLSADARDLLQR
jgi:thiosulfate/3-mercaptopyruvate sulfurtransferase